MNPQTALWLNRLGLLLDLMAFFFAAPELLGGRRLLAVERVFERGLRLLPPIAAGSALLALIAFLGASIGRVPRNLWRDIWRAAVVSVSAIVLTLAGIVILRLTGRAAAATLDRLPQTDADQADIGQQFLVLGAFLFVLGMALQFLATF